MPAESDTQVPGQPTRKKQVRVFISSTFRDMHAERDHLVTVVFPELRERVEQLGLEFFDVDLRWGVPAKDLNGETANSWEYCRQWIDRVEPFFVCILGERYGWVPEPHQFREPADRQRQEQEPRSITDLEVRHAALDSRRKRRSYFYLRATSVPVPSELAGEYVDPAEYQGRLEQLKTAVRRCGRPARDYRCRWTGQGFAEMEEFGRLVLEDLWSGVLRDERYVSKEVWRQVLGADPDTDQRYTDESQPVPRELWEKIVAKARPAPVSALDAERQQMEAFATTRLRWFQGRTHELQQLTDFIHSTAPDAPRLAVVAAVPGQGKSALIAKLHERLSEAIPSPAPPAGEGQGEGPSVFLITHFVGATERSATAHALVERLLDELDRSGIEWPGEEQKEGEEPKRDFNSLCHQLAKRLGECAGERRIVILLDGLNQLTDGHGLVWLPHRLGPQVRAVVSCVDDSSGIGVSPVASSDPTSQTGGTPVPLSPEQRVLHALGLRQPAPVRVPLGLLTEDEVRTIVVEYLNEYCKELDREHVDAICHMEQARNPLYLLVMLGELRTLGGNDMNRIVGERISALPRDFPDTVALFRWVLQRLEVFGPEAVQWWCLYLAHGRVGMASHELAALLARKLDAHAAVTALLIERGLRRYLLRRGGQMDFFHGQLRQAVMEQYGSQPEPDAVHREMADYFTACAKGTAEEWETDSVRGFAECVYQLIKAGEHEQAAGLLSNLPFLLHKLRVGLLEGVFEDYDIVRPEAPAQVMRRLEIWSDFFREKAHILRRANAEWPAHKILLQLAVEHADDSPLTLGAEHWLAEGHREWLWLRRVPRPPRAQKNPCQAVLEGHAASVGGALELSDGRLLSWSMDCSLRLWDGRSGACLAVLEQRYRNFLHRDDFRISLGALALVNGRLLSWAGTEELYLWDGQSGRRLAILEGHAGEVDGALELSDGRLLSWSRDQTLRLWDGQSGACLAVLEGHTKDVMGALGLSDRRLLSWSRDMTLRIWDAQRGTCLAVLAGHTDLINGALELSDNRLLSWSEDQTLRLWDASGGARGTTRERHTGHVLGALSLSGERLLSWSHDGTLRLWDALSGACLDVLKGHTDWVLDALELAAGRLLSWSRDATLRLWEGQGGFCLAVFEGHSRRVNGALELADGRLLSCSDDQTLRLWDARGGASLAVLHGHTDGINGAIQLADGRLLSWSNDMTLRIWDAQRGTCLAVLAGHTDYVHGALEMSDNRVLSWSGWPPNHSVRMWDTLSSTGLGPPAEDAVASRHPEWLNAQATNQYNTIVFRDFSACARPRSAHLHHKAVSSILAVWNSETGVRTQCLVADGTAVVTQRDGQVCILRLHHGQRRISLAEAEALLRKERSQESEVRSQKADTSAELQPNA